MRIRQVKTKTEGEFVIISAKCKIRCFGEDEIYFKINKKYSDFILADASPFAAALVIPAMKIGENLIIDGSLSEGLYKNMQQIMRILLSWNVGFKPIKIIAKKIVKDTQSPHAIGSFFSGGVDSFYTYLKNKKTKDGKLTHLILANGYDIALPNKSLWKKTRKHVMKIAQTEGIQVIEVESNIQPLLEPIVEWEFTFGGCLGAIALLLRNKFKRVFIASSFAYNQQFPGGSTADTDKLWGTDKLTIVHDGAEATRVEKVKIIARSKLVLDNLRVCYLNLKDTYNCGRCDKCLRTMISLQIAGKLSKAKTFPHTVNVDLVKKLPIQSIHTAVFHEENLAELKRLQIEPELQNAIEQCLSNSSHPFSVFHTFITKAMYFDHRYTKGKLYTVYTKIRNDLADVYLLKRSSFWAKAKTSISQ